MVDHMRKKKYWVKRSKLFTSIQFTLLILGTIIILYPLVWMILSSLKSDEAIKSDMYSLIPVGGIQVKNYVFAWQTARLYQNGFNSLIITVISLFFIVLLSYLTSYALARINFRGRNILMTMFVALMLVPLGQVTMIPQYQIIKKLGLINKLSSVILLYINGGIPISVFLLTSFLETIPRELDESAFLDGAKRLRIIYSIYLPLSAPGLATVIIFQFMNIWNDYFTPLIYLQTPEVRTVTLGLANFTKLWGQVEYNYLFAALCMVSVPVILVYLLFQNLFITGITAGAVKM
ncbi:MAG TPA: carbohydrate ABC transporter permease [Clostridiales bacterium]|nr:carbohydrate ABC transporter permease [Clostridiales bacterium]